VRFAEKEKARTSRRTKRRKKEVRQQNAETVLAFHSGPIHCSGLPHFILYQSI
jgi:hypothetical protein